MREGRRASSSTARGGTDDLVPDGLITVLVVVGRAAALLLLHFLLFRVVCNLCGALDFPLPRIFDEGVDDVIN